MWVVKLGGSLHRDGHLLPALKALAAVRSPVLVVPGGGVFADRVRSAQRRRGFSDAAAHRLALRAMDRMGGVMGDVAPGLGRVRALADAAGARGAAVWLPAAELDGDPALAASWDVTSDTIAALAAARLGARGLVLVKSSPLPGAPLAADAAPSRRRPFPAPCGCCTATGARPCARSRAVPRPMPCGSHTTPGRPPSPFLPRRPGTHWPHRCYRRQARQRRHPGACRAMLMSVARPCPLPASSPPAPSTRPLLTAVTPNVVGVIAYLHVFTLRLLIDAHVIFT